MGHGSEVSTVNHRWGVILAGGDGVRLRPLTRLACGDNRPKQFCPLLRGKTLLTQTQSRISEVIASDRVLFVLNQAHEPFYGKALERVPGERKVVQPANRGTLPAILWSLLRVLQLDRRAVVAFLPSDHYFVDDAGFRSALDSAFESAEATDGSVVLLGATANRPETEYGWIEPAPRAMKGVSIFGVKRFWEKPSRELTEQLIAKKCLWNTFVMVGMAEAFLAIIRRTTPGICEAIERLLTDGDAEAEEDRMQQLYSHLSPCDFSREVLSVSTEALSVVSCGDIGWSDLGDPQRFLSALSAEGVEIPCSVRGLCEVCSGKHGAKHNSGDAAEFVGNTAGRSGPVTEGRLL